MNKLSLVGTGTSIFEVDYNDANLDIWICGTAFSENYTDKIKRCDLGFEIHKLDRMIKLYEESRVNVDYNKYGCPIMVQNSKEKLTKEIIDNPVTFPLLSVLKFGGKRFYTSTFSYMIVYAVMQGYKDITLNNILLNADKEYIYEVPCIEYWCNLLTQRENVHFHIPEDSEIFSSHKLYAYEEYRNEYKVISRTRWLWEKFDRNLCSYEKLLADLNKNLGVKQTLEFLKSNPSIESIDKLYNESCRISNQSANAIQSVINDMNCQKGALQVGTFYKDLIE